MRYKSKVETERHRWLDLAAAIAHIKTIHDCDETELIRDIEAAVCDEKIRWKWEDQKRQPFGSSSLQWVPPISDALPEIWEIDDQKRLKDSTGRFRTFLLLRFALDCCFKEQESPEPLADLGDPPKSEIHKAITTVYDVAKAHGRKPPNIKELPGAVHPLLKARGYQTSGRNIQKLGDCPEHKRRRRLPGKTLASQHRSKRK